MRPAPAAVNAVAKAGCGARERAVLTPSSKNDNGGVVFLGTPQVEDTLYEKLTDRGYDMRVWPAEMPENISKYKGRLSPGILASELSPGAATDPDRFDNAELAERRIEFGGAGYALQFMLDTDISAENLHPLKTKDFIVTDIDVDVAPAHIPEIAKEERLITCRVDDVDGFPRRPVVRSRFDTCVNSGVVFTLRGSTKRSDT